jgi:hypothetical protein
MTCILWIGEREADKGILDTSNELSILAGVKKGKHIFN